MKISGILLTLTMVASLGVVSCAGTGGTGLPTGNIPAGGSSGSTGKLEVRVTDAPPDQQVTSIMLTVSKLQVHKAVPGGDLSPSPTNTTAISNSTVTPTVTPTNATVAASLAKEKEKQQDDGKDDQSGWITIPFAGIQGATAGNQTAASNRTFDLIKLKGVEELLGTPTTLEAGKYSQVRITVDSAQVTIGNSTPQPATVPSGELKFIHGFDIIAGKTTVIVMDFDAEKSVNITGNDKIMIKPVVKLFTKDPGAKVQGQTVTQTPEWKPAEKEDKPKGKPDSSPTTNLLPAYGFTVEKISILRPALREVNL